MKTRDFKTKLYKQMAKVTKALSNPNRLEILDLLAQGAVPVEYIAEHTNQPVANVSQHLQVLKKSGLVTTERKGKYQYYRLSGKDSYDAWCKLRKFGLSQNKVLSKMLDDFRDQKQSLEIISTEDLIKKMKKKEVILIDVRPEAEYEQGHIRDAISMPQKTLKQHAGSLSKETNIVAYCRGPLCLMADEAVSKLTEMGYKALRLENGYPDWEAKGLPVEIKQT